MADQNINQQQVENNLNLFKLTKSHQQGTTQTTKPPVKVSSDLPATDPFTSNDTAQATDAKSADDNAQTEPANDDDDDFMAGIADQWGQQSGFSQEDMLKKMEQDLAIDPLAKSAPAQPSAAVTPTNPPAKPTQPSGGSGANRQLLSGTIKSEKPKQKSQKFVAKSAKEEQKPKRQAKRKNKKRPQKPKQKSQKTSQKTKPLTGVSKLLAEIAARKKRNLSKAAYARSYRMIAEHDSLESPTYDVSDMTPKQRYDFWDWQLAQERKTFAGYMRDSKQNIRKSAKFLVKTFKMKPVDALKQAKTEEQSTIDKRTRDHEKRMAKLEERFGEAQALLDRDNFFRKKR